MQIATTQSVFGVLSILRLTALILVLLLCSLHASTVTTLGGTPTTETFKVGVDISHTNLHTGQGEISNFTNFLTANGGGLTLENTTLDQGFLNSINLLIISSPTRSYSSSELTLLNNWLASGGSLWLTGSSENTTAITNINSILQRLGASSRLEYGHLSDSLFNLNSTQAEADSLIAPVINHQFGTTSLLTQNVRILYAYRPVPIITFNGTSYARYDPTKQSEETWIAMTSSTAMFHNSTISPLALKGGLNTTLPIAMTERLTEGNLLVTGTPLFSSWQNTFGYLPTKPQDDKVLVKNLIQWLTKSTLSGESEIFIPRLTGTAHPLILIDRAHVNQYSTDADLQPLTTLLTDMGFNVQINIPPFTINSIKNASAIIIQAPQGGIGTNDTDALKAWLKEGNKLLLLASASDYTINPQAYNFVSTYLNGGKAVPGVLLSIGSILRFETGALTDTEVNSGGNNYQVILSNLNHQWASVSNLTTNVRSLFLPLGTILTGWNGTSYIPLETNLAAFANVTWLARSSNSSVVYNLDPKIPLQIHKSGQQGSYITAAMETGKDRDRILLFGGPIFSGFDEALRYPSLYGTPADNLVLIRDIFSTILSQAQTQTELTASPTTSQLQEGEMVTLNVQYSSLQYSSANLSQVGRFPVASPTLKVLLSGTNLQVSQLPNGTYTATGRPGGTGSISWSASATAIGYVSGTTSGTVQVNPLPSRFTYYVITIPAVIFIAVTIAVVARKTR